MGKNMHEHVKTTRQHPKTCNDQESIATRQFVGFTDFFPVGAGKDTATLYPHTFNK